MRLAGRPRRRQDLQGSRLGPVAEEARQTGGPPIWDVMAQWLRSNKEVSARPLNLPTVRGMDGNPGMMG